MTKGRQQLLIEYLKCYCTYLKRFQITDNQEDKKAVDYFSEMISLFVESEDLKDLAYFFDIAQVHFECFATCPRKEQTQSEMSKIADEIIYDKFVPQKDFQADYSDCHGF